MIIRRTLISICSLLSVISGAVLAYQSGIALDEMWSFERYFKHNQLYIYMLAISVVVLVITILLEWLATSRWGKDYHR